MSRLLERSSQLETHEGTDRIVVLTKRHAIKFRHSNSDWDDLEEIWSNATSELKTHILENYDGQLGWLANEIEADLWKITHSKALVPTISLGGKVNIQPRGDSLRTRCNNKMYLDPIDNMLKQVCSQETRKITWMVQHTLGRTGNYVFDKNDNLRLCDYGDQHVQSLIIRRQAEFESAMVKLKEELRALGI